MYVKPANFINNNPLPPNTNDLTLPDKTTIERSIQLEFEVQLQAVKLTEGSERVALTQAAHHESQMRSA